MCRAPSLRADLAVSARRRVDPVGVVGPEHPRHAQLRHARIPGHGMAEALIDVALQHVEIAGLHRELLQHFKVRTLLLPQAAQRRDQERPHGAERDVEDAGGRLDPAGARRHSDFLS